MSSDDVKQFVYSIDEETFHDKENFDEMIERMKEDIYGFNPTNDMIVYVGEKKPITYQSLISIPSLFENINDAAWDEAGEFADGFYSQLSSPFQKSGSTNELKNLIADYLEQHCGSIQFYSVLNVKKSTYGKYAFNKED